MRSNFVINRRKFLKALALTTGSAAMGSVVGGCSDRSAEFRQGVASGDPLQDRVVIWTRATPESQGMVLVQWEVAEDEGFSRVVRKGETYTDESIDYTVKIDVDGLAPSQSYFYRFKSGGSVSSTGETRTLPVGAVDSLNFAVFSCSNYPAGFFNVYREVANRSEDIDFAIHLGDYIYEYGSDGYATQDSEALGRVVDPLTELLTLSDYRKRYAQYRGDLDLQLVHGKLPFIVVWDDHEITNDTWREGAQNHNEGEGDFAARKQQAIQAYYEWMPIREVEPGNRERIYRSLDFGDLASLHMLDTRVIGRDKQLDYKGYTQADGGFKAEQFRADLTDPKRSLLGQAQHKWLVSRLQASQARWQVLGQQLLMGALALPAPLASRSITLPEYQALVAKQQADSSSLTPEERAVLSAPSLPTNLDAWDGYPAAREAVLQTGLALNKNIISIAGDTHNAWASDLRTSDGAAAGVEFATASVSSPGLEQYVSDVEPEVLSKAFVSMVDSLHYVNTQHRGFMVLSLSLSEASSEWVFIDTIKSRDYKVLESQSKKLTVRPGEGKISV